MHDWAPIKVDFIRRTLNELSASLAEKNIALRVLNEPDFQSVPRALVDLAKATGCDALYFNEEYEVNEMRRDSDVADRFEREVGQVLTFTDQCLFKPGTLRTGSGLYYSAFSPFRRKWLKAYADDSGAGKPLGKPRKLSQMVSEPDKISESVQEYEDVPDHAVHWAAGEREARKRLTSFLEKRIAGYQDKRDFPALHSTSVLSPYLACGSISMRRCVYEAVQSNDGKLETGSPGAVKWISELVWREFYKHIVAGFPRVSRNRAFLQITDRIKWNESADHFEAWMSGRTGIPIVDAAMRQLVQTGWMHNRLRMVTSMFLAKNLFLDWRIGERFFMRHLIDGDLASNNGGWQWSASTGADSSPYFRVMNPVAQSKRFDPDGAFIRKYVPEHAHLDPADIHEPSRLHGTLLRKLDYPDPIVDLSRSRRHAIESFRALK